MRCQNVDQVYVSGLSGDVTEEDLAAHFGSIGMLKEDKKRGKPKIWLYRDKATNALKASLWTCKVFTSSQTDNQVVRHLTANQFHKSLTKQWSVC